MQYVGRPGISPALAVLIALGRVRRDHRILDVGCGNGTDALLLARWGFRRVDAVDPDARAVATARARATRQRLGRRVTFHHMAAESLEEAFAPRSFDVVLHTLVANNLRKEVEPHFRAIARVMKPDGLLLLHERVAKRSEDVRPGGFGPLSGLRRYFRVEGGIATQLAEHRTGRPGPAYARVVLWVGRPRARR